MKRETSLSPPPLKRQRLQASASDVTQPKSTSTQPPAPESPNKAIRIISWNINGLQPFIPASAAPITSYFKPIRPDPTTTSTASPQHPPNSLRAFLSRHSWPEVLFLQELKISPPSQPRIAALLTTLNTPLSPTDVPTPETSYTVADMVLPRDRFNAKGFNGRLYGVGTILRKDFAQRHVRCVRGVDWDLEGRVGVVETREGRNGRRPLALVNVYAVNGTSAPYMDPATGKAEGRTRHDHKIAFHSRLRDEAVRLEGEGLDVVIAGDLNVARGRWDGHPNLRTWPPRHCRNREDFNRKFFGRGDCLRAGVDVEGVEEAETGFDGVDVFRAVHGGERRYTYYPRTRQWGTSADRVDLIIVSRRMWEEGRVRGTDILDTPLERGPSDHVPLWVDVVVE
ncbi:DNase I-like protein [Coniochaeta hoffmannii]|uniref:DNase I-like protein n=1 Tax=Coniochaeta hoffmannii TaxID=91930 RepID=A0AA38R4A8_9PEZI|nr:DNase I-like protein [Coniochaeta hoffmannii]